jgi:anthranilate synthase component 1
MDFKDFEKAAAKGYTVIPLHVVLAADTVTPVSLYLAARGQGLKGFLLESVDGGRHLARYSIIGVNPRERITARGGQVFCRNGGGEVLQDEPFPEVLKARLGRMRALEVLGIGRFSGGYVGYIGYNCAAMVERLPVKADPLGLPDAVLERFDDLIVYDHARGQVALVANAVIEGNRSIREAYDEAESRLVLLEKTAAAAAAQPLGANGHDAKPFSQTTRDTYASGVERAREHIRRGDIFQVVLSIQERLFFNGDPFEIYRRLRMANPSPYHFYLDQKEAVILGASPEMLARIEEGVLEVRPIAGTRPRGATEAEDEALQRELLNDPKEAAEHVMLVDLGRNDAGRVCEYGSVEVATFRSVERFSHVMHLVSSVKGRLKKDVHPVDAFFACFPAGTVTGAPKIRAMEIIAALEKVGRGVYSGAVGYFGYHGNMDTCIAIRTLVARGNAVQVQAGAGIVADSAAEAEFAECGHKVAALKAALGGQP